MQEEFKDMGIGPGEIKNLMGRDSAEQLLSDLNGNGRPPVCKSIITDNSKAQHKNAPMIEIESNSDHSYKYSDNNGSHRHNVNNRGDSDRSHNQSVKNNPLDDSFCQSSNQSSQRYPSQSSKNSHQNKQQNRQDVAPNQANQNMLLVIEEEQEKKHKTVVDSYIKEISAAGGSSFKEDISVGHARSEEESKKVDGQNLVKERSLSRVQSIFQNSGQERAPASDEPEQRGGGILDIPSQ